MTKELDLANKRFGRLVALEKLGTRKQGRIVWHCQCDCGNEVDVISTYLTTGQTTSCGCAKKDRESKNLREAYEDKRVDGVMMPLFKGKEPRKNSSTGYRGVAKYYTRKSKELRYRAWITVQGKQYYKSGFRTPEEAYYRGRLELERLYLPQQEGERNDTRD